MILRIHFAQTCSLLIFRSVASQKTHGVRVGCPSVAGNDQEPTQHTRPKKGKPIEIPVPKREAFDKLVRRASKKPAKR
jgi:hypothetical protein